MVTFGEGGASQESLTIQDVEDKIRKAIHTSHARTDEYLKDFDKLRSGYMSRAQFQRCLNQFYGIVLSPEEESLLIREYGQDPKQPGMINYRHFSQVIDSVFNPDVMDVPPTSQRIGVASVSSSGRRPLSASSLARVHEILNRISMYYKYHGISIKTSYEDFDKHNIGLVTESQFYRSLPGPSDLTESEMHLLAKKYRQENRPGLCNYLDFHEEVLRAQEGLPDQNTFQDLPITGYQTNFDKDTNQLSELQGIFEKLRVCVHKNGIRTTEFFKDHDKLRSGVITENQFVCGLSLCCGNHLTLSRAEIQQLVNYYKTEDGRVRYKEFCDVMENAFNIPNLEKKPTQDIRRPPIGALAVVPNTLTSREEEGTEEVLQQLRDTVTKKRLMLYPYFKDFDRAKGYTRGITKSQFSRILHMIGLNVSLPALELLCKKFEYKVGGDINYPAFIQSIDSEFTAFVKPSRSGTDAKQKSSPEAEQKEGMQHVDVGEIMAKIRHYVMVNGLRVEEYFQDFDPLRHGSISATRFRMGLSAMKQHDLTDAQFLALAGVYADDRRKGNVLWREFLRDVEVVFTQRDLEKAPTYSLPPEGTFFLPKDGSQKWNRWPDEKKCRLDSIMDIIRVKVENKRMMIKPCFQDFDRHKIGYITPSQFLRCLSSLNLADDEEEMNLVTERFSDISGINYIRFLEELLPAAKEDSKYLRRLEELERVNSKKMKDGGSEDIVEIMEKIRDKVVRERVRVLEFLKDYDHLRTGRVLKTVFPRALDLCQLCLTKKECDVLLDHYSSPGHPDYVDYALFSDDVESVFTIKGLEKAPLMRVQQYYPLPPGKHNYLAPEEEAVFEEALQKIADRVRMRRIQLFPLFEDYDRVHNGSVSRSQFHRVMSELELSSLINSYEFLVLSKKFNIQIGGKQDFNYIAFCDMIYACAQFEHAMP